MTIAPPPDTTPPQISGVSVTPTGTTALVSWVTNEDANSRVDYGLTTSYGASATNAASTLTHSVLVTGLTPTTTYHFKVTSTDGVNDAASTATATFTTNTQPAGPVIGRLVRAHTVGGAARPGAAMGQRARERDRAEADHLAQLPPQRRCVTAAVDGPEPAAAREPRRFQHRHARL